MRAAALLLLLPATVLARPARLDSGLPDPVQAPSPRALPTDGERRGDPALADPPEHPLSGSVRGISVGLYGDVLLHFRLAQRQDLWLSEFEVNRVLLGAYVGHRDLVGANVAMETVRSSGARSYFGVDGDSIVPRLRHAFVEVTPLQRWLSLRGGMVPDLLLPVVERAWDLRALGQLGLERDGLVTVADLGATAEVALPLALGSLALSYGNGEGVALREQNFGKNVTVALRLRPGRQHLPGLWIHALYRDGSLGAGSAADRRVFGGVIYGGARLGLGVVGSYAMGYRGIGDRDAGALLAFARGQLPFGALLFGRAEALWPDARAAASQQLRLSAGLGYALPWLVRLHVAYDGTLAFGALANQIPAVREHGLLVAAEARL